jgi:hypothetical protein
MATNCANRRLILPGAFASSLRTFAISDVPWRPGLRAHRKDDLSKLSSRDISQNSNGRFVGTLFRSEIIALLGPTAEKTFSADLRVGTAGGCTNPLREAPGHIE